MLTSHLHSPSSDGSPSSDAHWLCLHYFLLAAPSEHPLHTPSTELLLDQDHLPGLCRRPLGLTSQWLHLSPNSISLMSCNPLLLVSTKDNMSVVDPSPVVYFLICPFICFHSWQPSSQFLTAYHLLSWIKYSDFFKRTFYLEIISIYRAVASIKGVLSTWQWERMKSGLL